MGRDSVSRGITYIMPRAITADGEEVKDIIHVFCAIDAPQKDAPGRSDDGHDDSSSSASKIGGEAARSRPFSSL